MLGKALTTAAAGAGGVEKDEYFNQTTLLLHGDGFEGANNASNPGPPEHLAFTDNSSNNFPFTINGDAYGTLFSPHNTSWSNYFDTSAYLSHSADLVGSTTSTFTVEGWVYLTATPTSTYEISAFCGLSGQGNGANNYMSFGPTSDSKITLRWFDGTTKSAKSTNTLALNTWYYIACVVNSNTISLYINGVSEVVTGTSTLTDRNGSASESYVGGKAYTYATLSGYISNLKVSSVARTITPQTAPFSSDANTVLLTCQSNRFVDNSSNGFALTFPQSSNVAVTAFSPFAETDTRTGSGYFDGSGDLLSIPSAVNTFRGLGSNDFSYECFLYPLRQGNTYSQGLITYGQAGSTGTSTCDLVMNASGYLQLAYATGAAATLLSPSIARKNEWTHAAVCRSGSTLSMFVNGTRVHSVATGATVGANGNVVYIGNQWYAVEASRQFQGYISGVRVQIGSSAYDATQTTITVPTEPVASDANTELLTCQYRGTVRNVGFIDSGPQKALLTSNGNVTQGSYSPFSVDEGKWSNYFDGNDTLQIAASTGSWADFGTGEFTIEAWIYVPAVSGLQGICGAHTAGQANTWQFRLNGSALEVFGANQTVVSSASVIANQWNFVTASRSGANVYLGVNGSVNTVALTAGVGGLFSTTSGGNVSIGNLYSTPSNYWLTGYISNLRIRKGTADYTSSFTPSTSPLTAISNTELLTCQSNRFVDNSSNAFAITVNGNPSVQPLSPFAPSAAYDPAVNGGSASFDGSSDYVRVPSPTKLGVASTNFTMGFWFYPLTSSVIGLFDSGPSQANCFRNYGVNNIQDQNTSPDVSIAGAYNVNAWNWMCITKSGTSYTVYINGTSVGTGACSNPMVEGNFTIGAINGGGDGSFNGYISNFIFVNNSASVIPVPTAPLTATDNTTLLLNFTNAGIFDSAGKNHLAANTNTIKTNIKKYGSGSLTAGASVNPNPVISLGSHPFTLEWWMYMPDALQRGIIFNKRLSGSYDGWDVYINTGGSPLETRVQFQAGPSTIMSWGGIQSATWHHVVIQRSGTGTNQATAFLDGVLKSTFTLDSTYTVPDLPNPLIIGTGRPGFETYPGYVDDVRLTLGVARYSTSGFTPPEAPFPDL